MQTLPRNIEDVLCGLDDLRKKKKGENVSSALIYLGSQHSRERSRVLDTTLSTQTLVGNSGETYTLFVELLRVDERKEHSRYGL
jgi:hypothetical protein